MSRRRRSDEEMSHIVGVRSWFNGECPRCGDSIRVEERIVNSSRGWIHTRCASGQDE